MIRTSNTSSTAATTDETATTIHPAVTNGGPKIRLSSCPTVSMTDSGGYGFRARSEKSRLDWRALMYARTPSKEPRIANMRPTKELYRSKTSFDWRKSTYFGGSASQKDVGWLASNQGRL